MVPFGDQTHRLEKEIKKNRRKEREIGKKGRNRKNTENFEKNQRRLIDREIKGERKKQGLRRHKQQ